jgi:hypothetical protein
MHREQKWFAFVVKDGIELVTELAETTAVSMRISCTSPDVVAESYASCGTQNLASVWDFSENPTLNNSRKS